MVAKPELLAPAGNNESLIAAVENGEERQVLNATGKTEISEWDQNRVSFGNRAVIEEKTFFTYREG